MKTLTKILGISAITLGLLGNTNCDLINSDCPEGMERLSISKHGISNYIFYKDLLGQSYIEKNRDN